MSDSRSAHALQPALAAVLASLGLPACATTETSLLGYLDLLHHWNATYNLTSVRDPQGMLRQHVADCLAVIPAVTRQLDGTGGASGTLRVLDVGSGGGLPGVVLAVMFPHWQVTCVDTVGKKAAFIRQVALELKLKNLVGEHARVEVMKAGQFDLVTSRAFASLADFVQLTTTQLAPNGLWLAMKGRLPADEIAVLPPHCEVFHVEPLAVPGLDAERCLVWLKPRSG